MPRSRNPIQNAMFNRLKSKASGSRSTTYYDSSGVSVPVFLTKRSINDKGNSITFEGKLHKDFSKVAVNERAGKKISDTEIELDCVEKIERTAEEIAEYKKRNKRSTMIPKKREMRGTYVIKTGQDIRFSVYVGDAQRKKDSLMALALPGEATISCMSVEYWRGKDDPDKRGVSCRAKNVTSLSSNISPNAIFEVLDKIPPTVYAQYFVTRPPSGEEVAAHVGTKDFEWAGDDTEKIRKSLWLRALTDEEKAMVNTNVYWHSYPMNDEKQAYWNPEDESRGLLISEPQYVDEDDNVDRCFFTVKQKTEDNKTVEETSCHVLEKYTVMFWDTAKGLGSSKKPICYQVCHRIYGEQYMHVMGIVDKQLCKALFPVHVPYMKRITYCWLSTKDTLEHAINNTSAEDEIDYDHAICLVSNGCNSKIAEYVLDEGLPVNTQCVVRCVKQHWGNALETSGDDDDESIDLNDLNASKTSVVTNNPLNKKKYGVHHIPESRMVIHNSSVESTYDFRALVDVEIPEATMKRIREAVPEKDQKSKTPEELKRERDMRQLISDWLDGTYNDEMKELGLPRNEKKDEKWIYTVFSVQRNMISKIRNPPTEDLPDFSQMTSSELSLPKFVPLKGYDLDTPAPEGDTEATVAEEPTPQPGGTTAEQQQPTPMEVDDAPAETQAATDTSGSASESEYVTTDGSDGERKRVRRSKKKSGVVGKKRSRSRGDAEDAEERARAKKRTFEKAPAAPKKKRAPPPPQDSSDDDDNDDDDEEDGLGF